MTSITRCAIFLIPLKLIILMTSEALKLVKSKGNYGPIIPMYIINIFKGSFNINNEIYYFLKKILHNINFVNITFVGPKNQN
jgi:hypothetical protein